jgi:hypothetical protein
MGVLREPDRARFSVTYSRTRSDVSYCESYGPFLTDLGRPRHVRFILNRDPASDITIRQLRAQTSTVATATSVYSPDLNPIDRSSPSSSTYRVRRRALVRNHLSHNWRNPPSIYAHRMRHWLCPILKSIML